MKQMTTTLLVIRKQSKLLLARKLKGFGTGKINGCGGKCESGETPYNAMMREAYEELKIIPKNMQEVGVVDFDEYMKGERMLVNMHIFLATDFDGIPSVTEEMSPLWIDENAVPYDEMFPDDAHWLPLLLDGKKFYGKFYFDKEFNIISHELKLI